MTDKRETAAFRDQQADAMPASDPDLTCAGCGDQHPASYFDRDGQLSNDPEEPVLCGPCSDRPVGTRTVEERKRANQSLTAFGGGSDR